MDIQPIRTDDDHQAALAEIERLWGAADGTPEGDKLDVLMTLVEIYEERRFPLGSRRRFDPVDVLHERSRSLVTRRPNLAKFSARAHELPRFLRGGAR